MIRKFIAAIIFSGLASTAFASSVNYIQVTNNDSKGSVTVTYNAITKDKSTSLSMKVPPNQSAQTGVPVIGQEMPKYEITTITHNAPITSCPILQFNTVYKVILITIAKDGGCTAVTKAGE